jgi:hypothetical protein
VWYNPAARCPAFPFCDQRQRLRIPEENPNLLRSISFVISLCLTLLCAVVPLAGQDKPVQNKPAQDKATQEKATAPKPPQEKPGTLKTPTGEQVAEGAIFVYGGQGGRVVLDQIRRNGLERGRITRSTAEGRIEDATYERRFVRGADSSKDKIRVDQKMPTLEYSLVYGDGHLWGIINGASFTPRQDAINSFLSSEWHSIDALLRYKENGSTVTYVEKTKQKGLDLFVVDLTDKEKRVTRYYISVKTLRILWLEYEESLEARAAPAKFTRKFHDYRIAQGTLLPYHSVLFADDKQLQETHVFTVSYGIKLEDAIFQNPSAQANANP